MKIQQINEEKNKDLKNWNILSEEFSLEKKTSLKHLYLANNI